MDNFEKQQTSGRRRLVDSKSLFTVSLFVIGVTIVSIWLLGLGKHRTLFVNSLLSVSVLSVAFLLFIVTGLYRGMKMRDTVGRITDKYKFGSLAPDLPDDVDGCVDGEGFLLWLLAFVVAIVLVIVLGSVLWFLIVIFMAILYWIFFRALRLVFRKSYLCKGNLMKSLGYGVFYTVLYNFWIYGIIMAAHYFVKR
ncbi:MAG: hypothetical protein EOP49_18635 [Sphingobacteriales bacterium]|nr:MAG: hypothetical protein EOP49_18635 [Sphingobacteriales bacterium]